MSQGIRRCLKVLTIAFCFTLCLVSLRITPSLAEANNEAAEGSEPKVVSIGAVLPLTGELASKGMMTEAAIQTAVSVVNEYHRCVPV
ncbi:hypothetical protein [Marinicrinis lubricantis]|uniref:Leucine-binding protein domain-containing protein n=1 Tax=Marinicrinis lubricantis TaxID=2086470 RepID=A0ABW1IJS8_9BACL